MIVVLFNVEYSTFRDWLILNFLNLKYYFKVFNFNYLNIGTSELLQ